MTVTINKKDISPLVFISNLELKSKIASGDALNEYRSIQESGHPLARYFEQLGVAQTCLYLLAWTGILVATVVGYVDGDSPNGALVFLSLLTLILLCGFIYGGKLSRKLRNISEKYGFNGWNFTDQEKNELIKRIKLAEGGDAKSIRLVALHCYQGHGLPYNRKLSEKLLDISADLGDREAAETIVELFFYLHDRQKVYEWWTRAAELNSLLAERKLAEFKSSSR